MKVDWHTQTQFEHFHTYTWKSSKKEWASFYTQWVHTDVDREMASKGLHQVEANQDPDLYIYYRMVTQEVGCRETSRQVDQ